MHESLSKTAVLLLDEVEYWLAGSMYLWIERERDWQAVRIVVPEWHTEKE